MVDTIKMSRDRFVNIIVSYGTKVTTQIINHSQDQPQKRLTAWTIKHPTIDHTFLMKYVIQYLADILL